MALVWRMASDIFTVQLYKLGLRMCMRTSKAPATSGYVFEGQKVNFSCRVVLCSQECFWLQQLSQVSLQSCKKLLYVSWSDLLGATLCLKPRCSCFECKRSLIGLQRGLDRF